MVAILIVAVGVVLVYIFQYDNWYPNYGEDDTSEQEELLQLPSDLN